MVKVKDNNNNNSNNKMKNGESKGGGGGSEGERPMNTHGTEVTLKKNDDFHYL